MADTRKVTFTLDKQTVDRIDAAAERLGIPKSGVVREAVAEYAARARELTEAERLHMLRVLDEIMKRPPTRPRAEAEAEKAEIRRARRTGGRRSPAE